jgi:hypothetical protein
MKTTIKILLLAGFSFYSIHASAQNSGTQPVAHNSIIYSVGVEGGYSTGNFKDAYKWNLGGSLQADIPVAKDIYVTVNAGYNNFFGRNLDGNAISPTDIHLIPVTAGIKYFPLSMLYIQGSAGAAFALNKSDLNFDKTAAFMYVPQIGVQLPLGSSGFIDAGAFYKGTTSFSNSSVFDNKINYFGLRIAYAFSL